MYEPWLDPNRMSWACWEGKHARCDGWLVTGGPYDGGLSTRCECPLCWHPKIDPDRHLHENVAKGLRWNSLTASP